LHLGLHFGLLALNEASTVPALGGLPVSNRADMNVGIRLLSPANPTLETSLTPGSAFA
jgi:hypothetical protein